MAERSYDFPFGFYYSLFKGLLTTYLSPIHPPAIAEESMEHVRHGLYCLAQILAPRCLDSFFCVLQTRPVVSPNKCRTRMIKFLLLLLRNRKTFTAIRFFILLLSPSICSINKETAKIIFITSEGITKSG